MVLINSDTCQKNGVEVIIVDNIKWLNETNIEQQLKQTHFVDILQDNILPNLGKKDKNYKNVQNNLVESF